MVTIHDSNLLGLAIEASRPDYAGGLAKPQEYTLILDDVHPELRQAYDEGTPVELLIGVVIFTCFIREIAVNPWDGKATITAVQKVD